MARKAGNPFPFPWPDPGQQPETYPTPIAVLKPPMPGRKSKSCQNWTGFTRHYFSHKGHDLGLVRHGEVAEVPPDDWPVTNEVPKEVQAVIERNNSLLERIAAQAEE